MIANLRFNKKTAPQQPWYLPPKCFSNSTVLLMMTAHLSLNTVLIMMQAHLSLNKKTKLSHPKALILTTGFDKKTAPQQPWYLRPKCCSNSTVILSSKRTKMIVQFDTIHSDDCKSGLQQEDIAPAALILTTKMLFQLDSTDNDDCSSKPQQANKVFPSQGLDTDDWKPKPHLENCLSNSTLASTSENAFPTQQYSQWWLPI